MTKMNSETPPRKPIRRRSWLSRFLRDERGAAYTSDAVLVTFAVVTLGAVAAPAVKNGVMAAVGTVMGNLQSTVGGSGTNAGGGGLPNFNTAAAPTTGGENTFN